MPDMKTLTIDGVTYNIVDETARNGVAGIPSAVNSALAEAKASGEFKGDKGDTGGTGPQGPGGDPGNNGFSIYCTSETPTMNDWPFNPSSIVTNGRELQVGDMLLTPSSELFSIYGVSAGVIDANFTVSLKGGSGATGADGQDGLSIFTAPASALVASGTIRKATVNIPEGYTLKTGDLVLLDDGNMYRITGFQVNDQSLGDLYNAVLFADITPSVDAIKSGNETTIYINNIGVATINDGEDGEKGDPGVYVGTEEPTDESVQVWINPNGGTDLPDYVETEAEAVIDKVIAAQGNRTFTFAAITDLHYGSWGYYEGITDYRDGVNHACQALKYIDERIKLDAVAVLGDYTDGLAQTQQGTAVADFKGVNAVLDKLRFAPNLRLQGNHDFVVEKSPLAYRYIGAYSDGSVEWGNPLGGYFLKDFSAQKIRVICLNTSEIGNGGVDCSVTQYEWFINSLDLSTKEDASEWGILILSHVPLDMWANNGEYRFAYILDAYKNGTSWTDDTVSCDFSNGKNAAMLIGNIHGHVHNFKVDKLYLGNIEGNPPQSSVWRMATPNACFGAENKNYAGYQEDTAYTKTANSADDTAFCIYCIDLDSHTIKAICYGAGYDRELTYYTEPVAIVNALKNSTEADGITPYNGGQGWKAETRWSGSSDVEQTPYSGISLSGYIAYDGNAGKVYMKNVSTTSRIKVWYFQKDKMPSESWNRENTDVPNCTYDEAGNVTSFDLEAYADYIRIECGGFTADSVITINEPIE